MVGDLTLAVCRVRIALCLVVAALALTATLASSVPLAAAAEGPIWEITSYASPTNLPPGGTGELIVTAVNVGGAATNGSAITIEDTLPAGLTATGISGYDAYASGPVANIKAPSVKLSCSAPPSLVCTRSAAVQPGDQLVVSIQVTVEAGAPASVVNHASVSGGGAAQPASVGAAASVSSEKAGFGLAPGSVFAAVSSRRAGAHASVTTGFAMDNIARGESAGDPKDVRFDLPPGAVGNTVGLPKCTAALAYRGSCPADTIVGIATVEYAFFSFIVLRGEFPIFNIAPAPGEPAAFLFRLGPAPVRLDTSVLSDGDYAVRVTAGNISQAAPVMSTYVTVWGVPADHQGPGSAPIFGDESAGVENVGAPSAQTSRVPLLSNPTQCSKPLTAFAEADAWRNPGVFQKAESSMGTLEDCLEVPFASSFTLLPDTLEAGAPAGYRFHLRVPQQNAPDTDAASNVKKVVLALPRGVVVNPSAAWGLKACATAQFYGPAHPSEKPAEVGKCPREAQVGTVTVKTPALEEALEGQVYLAEPECDPCTPQDAEQGKMIRLFVQLVSEGEGGIVVKLEGHGMIDQKTGQITTVFDENPQLPFDEFRLDLTGGPRSVLANPRQCGTVTATADLQPWSVLDENALTSDSKPFYELEVNQNCFGPQFNPSFVAGSPNIQSGAYSPFTLSFGRSDDDQFLSGFSQTMPPGLLGNISSVPLCKEPQAAEGTCDQASLIGHVQVLTGPGANPFLVTGGQVFLTEGYKGAPYGLSIVVPAVAGPYTLSGTTGKGTVVVRAKIEVDPIDAHLTVTADPLPTVLDGIPLQLKVVNVTIDRQGGFTFNPTSCAKMAIGATMSSDEGSTATRSSSFQVTNCASLAFEPGFTASTSGKTSRTEGASLDVKLTYPTGAFGKDANVRSVKVELPKRLPSRLTTLQKACPAATFEANPAGCPAASMIGSATATTPIIPVALAGPAYFVSYGGAKFPELVIVLQGYGVSVQLHGETFISKAGITSSTFPAIPDVPVQSFELKLPEGSDSALAAIGNLCTGGALKMPTTFTAQNGTVINQSTPIAATGCPKHKATKHKTKHKASGKHKAKHGKGKGRKR